MLERQIPENRTKRQIEQKLFDRLRECCNFYVSTYSDYRQSVIAVEMKIILEKTGLADCYDGLVKNLKREWEERRAA